MRKHLAILLACGALALAATPSWSSNDPAMDQDVLGIALKWEHIKFEENGAPNQFDDIDALAKEAGALVQKYPGRVEPLIWQGITTSEEAGMASMLHAMGYAKAAKAILEQALAQDPAALSAGAPTSLGVLYYRVPGFPIGFGDKKKARALLEEAVKLAPDGMDANYFYADFLVTQEEYAAARLVLKHALALPVDPNRPLWDRHRRGVMRELLAKAESN